MSLFNLLVDLPHERLRRLANEFGVSSSSPSKRTILNDLTIRYRDEGFLTILVQNLPKETQGFLRALVFFTPETESILIPESLLRPWRAVTAIDALLTPLLDLGLLFNDSSYREEARFIFPEEIRRTMEKIFLAPYREFQFQGEVDLERIAVRSPGLEAIYHLLCVILHYRSVQTQKGAIHRKSVERWASRLGANPPGEDFFHFVFSFCMRANLLDLHRGRYRPSSHVLEWFSRDERLLRNELFSYYLETRLMSNPLMHLLPILFRTAQDWIAKHLKSPVFSIPDFVSQMGEEVCEEEIRLELDWFSHVGLIQFHDPFTPDAFFLTRDGIEFLCRRRLPPQPPAPKDYCVLQPNFDLLAPPGVGYPDLWRLEHLAEFKRRDIYTEYHLSQQSILFGMRRGWTHDETLAFIHELTGGKLSSNVKYSLDEWCRKYGQITLHRTVLVECATPELADEISHIPEISSLLERRISDRCYAASETHARDVLRLLRERGYEPSAAKRLTDEE
ncbi:MAG: helicase-associated domain-containing protein [Candidatus Omnitrophica bacterium]|nr:helicase-associated domain-containing protein [Candidatus Omnitrophota bacterium]